jgi:PAS domain-containing protein
VVMSLAPGPTELRSLWPLFQAHRQFDLGMVLSSAVIDAIPPSDVGALGVHHAGCWECDLSNDALTWSGGVNDIFGLPRGARVSRTEALAFYSERSRAALERLRSYAIRYKRGFTLDIEVRSATGDDRWVRLLAGTVCEDDRVVRIHGLKIVI